MARAYTDQEFTLETELHLGCRLTVIANNQEETRYLPSAGMLWLEESRKNLRRSPNDYAVDLILAENDGKEIIRHALFTHRKGDIIDFFISQVKLPSLQHHHAVDDWQILFELGIALNLPRTKLMPTVLRLKCTGKK